MIAPIRYPEPETSSSRRHLHEAHRVLASALLGQPAEHFGNGTRAPAVRPWRAWLFAGWVTVAAAAYCAWVLARW